MPPIEKLRNVIKSDLDKFLKMLSNVADEKKVSRLKDEVKRLLKLADNSQDMDGPTPIG